MITLSLANNNIGDIGAQQLLSLLETNKVCLENVKYIIKQIHFF